MEVENMSIDWGKTFKKVAITAAQAISGLVFSLPVTAKVVGFLAILQITVTPEQVTLVLTGVIAGVLELVRKFIKSKFGWNFL